MPDYLAAQLGLFEALTRMRLFWDKRDEALDSAIDTALVRLRELDPDGVRVNWYAVLPESAHFRIVSTHNLAAIHTSRKEFKQALGPDF